MSSCHQSIDDKTNNAGDHQCRICGKAVLNKHLKLHMTLHCREKPTSYDRCRDKSIDDGGSTRETNPSHSEILDSYDACQKFKSHIVIHTEDKPDTLYKPYICGICNMSYTTADSLKLHMRSHTKQPKITCKVCLTSFQYPADLQSHMASHELSGKDSPYKCEFCNKTFSRRGHLTEHFHIHSGEKLYTCEICCKKFTRRQTLNSHMLIHTCKVCGQSLRWRNDLREHMLIHTQESRVKFTCYTCKICKKHFFQRKELSAHMLTHAGI